MRRERERKKRSAGEEMMRIGRVSGELHTMHVATKAFVNLGYLQAMEATPHELAALALVMVFLPLMTLSSPKKH